MTPPLRKFALTVHVAVSVGWLGAVVAYLALAIAGLTSRDPQTVRAAYLSMELIGWLVIVPCSLATLATGLVQSLGTAWGLFQHHWVQAKFFLTTIGTAILLRHMAAVSRMSGIAAETTLSGADFGALRSQLVVHAGGGLLVLLAATALSVFKPWGRTRYGRRKLHTSREVSQPVSPWCSTITPHREDAQIAALPSRPDSNGDVGMEPEKGLTERTPIRVNVPLVIAVILVLLFILLHLMGGGLRGH